MDSLLYQLRSNPAQPVPCNVCSLQTPTLMWWRWPAVDGMVEMALRRRSLTGQVCGGVCLIWCCKFLCRQLWPFLRSPGKGTSWLMNIIITVGNKLYLKYFSVTFSHANAVVIVPRWSEESSLFRSQESRPLDGTRCILPLLVLTPYTSEGEGVGFPLVGCCVATWWSRREFGSFW